MLLATGGVIVTLACLYLALAQTLLGFYVAFTLARISDQGLIKIGAPPPISQWFVRFRGRATGMVFFAGAAGMIVMAPLVQLIIGVHGWRAAWVMLAGAMLLLGAVPCALLVRRRPEDMGLAVDGGPMVEIPSGNADSSIAQADIASNEEPRRSGPWPPPLISP